MKSENVLPFAIGAGFAGVIGYMWWRAQPHPGDLVGVPLSVLPIQLTPDILALAQGGKAGVTVRDVTNGVITGTPTALILADGRLASFPTAGGQVQVQKSQINGIYRNGQKIT